MTELTWLADLIVNHELADKTKKHVLKRMKVVETQINNLPGIPAKRSLPQTQAQAQAQAPSTIAALERQTGQAIPQAPIAVSPQAQAALAARESLILQSQSGKPEAGRTSPRKF